MALLAAVIATPVVIAAAFTLLSLWQLITTGSWSPSLAASAWLLVAALATPATLVMLVVAAPLARRLRRQGRTGLMPFVRLGIALAVLPFALFDGYVVVRELMSDPVEAPGVLMDSLPAAMKWATLAALCGAGSAAAYWTVARGR